MPSAARLLTADMRAFLRTTARRVLESCAVPPGATCGGRVNTLGFRAITPGGYPAVWVQDFTMHFSSGLVAREDGLHHLQLVMRSQNDSEPRDLGCNVIVPPYAIPDHINVDGTPVFFPGTYDPAANQAGRWGLRPPANNHYEVIWLAEMLAHGGNGSTLLNEIVAGKTIYQRLQRAFAVPEVNPTTELVSTTPQRRAVGYIFCDSVYMTGDLLMASLLRQRAAEHLAELAACLGHAQESARYWALAQTIAANILPTFTDDQQHSGWLKASTGISGQPDVWGTIYALYRAVIPGPAKQRLLQTIIRALENPGEIEFQGAIRQVPVSHDASPDSAWERTMIPKNRYQNGAYWHLPIAWLLAVLQDGYPDQARALRDRWLDHLRAEQGRIWECIGWQGSANQNPAFAPSLTLPLGVLGERGVGNIDAPRR